MLVHTVGKSEFLSGYDAACLDDEAFATYLREKPLVLFNLERLLDPVLFNSDYNKIKLILSFADSKQEEYKDSEEGKLKSRAPMGAYENSWKVKLYHIALKYLFDHRHDTTVTPCFESLENLIKDADEFEIDVIGILQENRNRYLHALARTGKKQDANLLMQFLLMFDVKDPTAFETFLRQKAYGIIYCVVESGNIFLVEFLFAHLAKYMVEHAFGTDIKWPISYIILTANDFALFHAAVAAGKLAMVKWLWEKAESLEAEYSGHPTMGGLIKNLLEGMLQSKGEEASASSTKYDILHVAAQHLRFDIFMWLYNKCLSMTSTEDFIAESKLQDMLIHAFSVANIIFKLRFIENPPDIKDRVNKAHLMDNILKEMPTAALALAKELQRLHFPQLAAKYFIMSAKCSGVPNNHSCIAKALATLKPTILLASDVGPKLFAEEMHVADENCLKLLKNVIARKTKAYDLDRDKHVFGFIKTLLIKCLEQEEVDLQFSEVHAVIATFEELDSEIQEWPELINKMYDFLKQVEGVVDHLLAESTNKAKLTEGYGRLSLLSEEGDGTPPESLTHLTETLSLPTRSGV